MSKQPEQNGKFFTDILIKLQLMILFRVIKVILLQAGTMKEYLVTILAATNPKPRSRTILLIVPCMVASDS